MDKELITAAPSAALPDPPALVISGRWPHLATRLVAMRRLAAPPSVGVAVPVHQNADVIEETVDAILGNLLPGDRLALVENGSRDDSLAILRARFGNRPEIIIDTLPAGDAARARNRAVQLLGDVDFVAFCDGDDRWMPQRLHRVRCVLAETAADVLVQPMIANTVTGAEVEGATLRLKSLPRRSTLLADLLFAGNFISTSGLVIRRVLLPSTPFADGLKRTQDYEAWCRFAAENPNPAFAYLDEPAAFYRRAGGLSADRWQRAENVFRIRRSYAARLNPRERAALWLRRHAWLLGWALRTHSNPLRVLRVTMSADDPRWFRGAARAS